MKKKNVVEAMIPFITNMMSGQKANGEEPKYFPPIPKNTSDDFHFFVEVSVNKIVCKLAWCGYDLDKLPDPETATDEDYINAMYLTKDFLNYNPAYIVDEFPGKEAGIKWNGTFDAYEEIEDSGYTVKCLTKVIISKNNPSADDLANITNITASWRDSFSDVSIIQVLIDDSVKSAESIQPILLPAPNYPGTIVDDKFDDTTSIITKVRFAVERESGGETIGDLRPVFHINYLQGWYWAEPEMQIGYIEGDNFINLLSDAQPVYTDDKDEIVISIGLKDGGLAIMQHEGPIYAKFTHDELSTQPLLCEEIGYTGAIESRGEKFEEDNTIRVHVFGTRLENCDKLHPHILNEPYLDLPMHVSFESKIGYFLTTDAYALGSETAQAIIMMGSSLITMDNSEGRDINFNDE